MTGQQRKCNPIDSHEMCVIRGAYGKNVTLKDGISLRSRLLNGVFTSHDKLGCHRSTLNVKDVERAGCSDDYPFPDGK